MRKKRIYLGVLVVVQELLGFLGHGHLDTSFKFQILFYQPIL